MHSINPESLLRIRQIIGNPKAGIPAIINVSKSTWWSWSAAQLVGPPVRIGGATFWRAADVLRLVDRSTTDVAANDATASEPTGKQKLRTRSAGGQL